MDYSKNKNISFIIPAYNCQDTIAESVESIFNGNFSDGDEVIIVDDASTDNTLQVAESLQKKYPSINIFRHNYNKGTAAAGRNTGIDNSKNDLIFCLDADNVLYPESVPKLKEFILSKNADAAAFGELHYFVENKKQVTHRWIFNDEIKLADCFVGNYNPCSSGNYLFTKASWIKAGRYTEPTLINQTLDSWTFAVRQIATGTKIVTLKNTYYFHRYGINSHYIREYKKGNVSLSALVALIPFLDRLNESDLEYITSKKERSNWFHNLKNHPIRLKSGEIGRDGKGVDIKGNPLQTPKKPSNFQIMRTKIISAISSALPNSNKKIIRGKDICCYISKRLDKYFQKESLQQKRVIPWFKIQGDKTLRLDYDLNESSLVFDVGGYEGQWASDIFSKYCCFIHVFEPVEEFAENIEKRFYKNKKIIVHRFGLSNKNETVKIALAKDGSSTFKTGGNMESIVLVKAIDFMQENNIKKIDLMKINIEGGEYDLLEHLIDLGFINNIKNIQIQFHDIFPDAEQRMARIHKNLEKTHVLTYQYLFVWENWKIKECKLDRLQINLTHIFNVATLS